MMSDGPITLLGIVDQTPEQRREKILTGIFAVLFRQVPQAVLVSFFGGVALVAVFWNTHNQDELILWFIALLLESLLRLRAARAFQFGREPATQTRNWANRWLWMAAAGGALWGTAGYHFYQPQLIIQQLVFMAIVLSVIFGSLTLYASYGPGLFFYLPMVLLPLVLRMVAQHDPANYTGAAIVLAVLGFTLFFGRNFGRTISESVRSTIENEVLVRQLLAEKRTADLARRAAEAATRSKTQFFAAASHDLRQPLQAIGIYCSLLRKRASGPLVPLVRNLSTGVETLSKLVEELLEISRLDSGAIVPQVAPVALIDIFLVLQREFLPLAAAKRLDLRIRPTRLVVTTDALLLSRVLRNLVANAIRYTARGGILMAARRRGETVTIDIWDTGPGIHQQELNRVFEEFYRGESSKTEVGGTGNKGFGLGLSIVRRICGVLGHALTVRTRPGSGTLFRVTLPLSHAPHPRRSNVQESAESAIQPIPGQRIVVLEDNEAILNSLTRLLRSWGADVISATGFTGALVKHLGRDRRADLIVADQNLGGPVDGAEAVFRIRELIGVPIPVIMLTAVGAMDVLAEFQQQMNQRMRQNPEAASAIASSRVEEPIVLTKPTEAAVLNARILTALGIAPMDPITLSRNQKVAEGREERIL
jgi:signal transduction histidine kinase/CheY-like chemotaxis protein